MGVFSGEDKRAIATKVALKIKWSISNLLNLHLLEPLIIGCGIDVGETLITRIGKGEEININDLIWIGKACSFSNQLTTLARNSIIISEEVYSGLTAETKFQDPNSDQKNMWTEKKIPLNDNVHATIYESNYNWVV